MQAQSMIEDYYVVIYRNFLYGNYVAACQTYNNKEKAEIARKELLKDYGKNHEAFVCRVGLPFIYDASENKT